MRGPQGRVGVTQGSCGDKVLCSPRPGPACSALGWGQLGTAIREQREWGCPTLRDKMGAPPKPQPPGCQREPAKAKQDPSCRR